VLATRVAFEGKEVEMLYSGCATSRSLCVFSDSLTRCAECVRCSVRCDGNFSIDDFDRLTIKQRKLKAVRDAILERIPQEIE
jgi:heterodisulfide reductase subunit C